MPTTKQETAQKLKALIDDIQGFELARLDIYARWKQNNDDWDDLRAELTLVDRVELMLENMEQDDADT
jgi:hypothetical protein|tara:strand:- start:4784 stop:4987 length:204 start_codon:yes stop_codon:yes gene_type:complete